MKTDYNIPISILENNLSPSKRKKGEPGRLVLKDEPGKKARIVEDGLIIHSFNHSELNTNNKMLTYSPGHNLLQIHAKGKVTKAKKPLPAVGGTSTLGISHSHTADSVVAADQKLPQVLK